MRTHPTRQQAHRKALPKDGCGGPGFARALGPGHTIVTLLCDRGSLYSQRLFNPAWLREKGLSPD